MERMPPVTSVAPVYEFVPLRVSAPAPAFINPESVDQVELGGDRNGPIGPLAPELRTSEPLLMPPVIVACGLPPLTLRTLVAVVHVAAALDLNVVLPTT